MKVKTPELQKVKTAPLAKVKTSQASITKVKMAGRTRQRLRRRKAIRRILAEIMAGTGREPTIAEVLPFLIFGGSIGIIGRMEPTYCLNDPSRPWNSNHR